MGMGSQFGSANTSGAYQTEVQTKNMQNAEGRRERQFNVEQDAREKKQTVMNDVVAHQQSLKPNDLQAKVDEQGKTIETMKKQASSKTTKSAINYAVATPTPQATKDSIAKIEADPMAMQTLGMNKGDIRVADTMDRDSIAKTYMAAGATQEESYKMADKSLEQGMSLVYKNSQVMDLFQLNEIMGTSSESITPVNNKIEENKASILNAGKTSETPEEWQARIEKETGTDPKRKDELGSMTNDQAQLEMDAVVDETGGLEPTTNPNDDGTTAVVETPYEMKVETEAKPKSADGSSTGSVKKGQAKDGTQIKADVAEDGSATVVASDGTTGKVDAQGDGEFKTVTGATTKVVGGESITVKSDGTIQKNETLPPHVRMAYDILGIKASEYGDVKDPLTQQGKYAQDYSNATTEQKKVMDELQTAKTKNQTYEQYKTTQLKNGEITQATFNKDMKEYKNLLAVKLDKTGQLFQQAEKMTEPIEGETVAEFEQRVGKNYEELVRNTNAKSNRAPTYVEEFKNSSAYLANNPDKVGTEEYEMHKTVTKRFSNELVTAKQKDNNANASTIMAKYNMKPSDAFKDGKSTSDGDFVDAQVRGNPQLYTKEIRTREAEAYDTAQSVANLNDLGAKIDKGVTSGKYKTGYLDSTVSWANKKLGSDYFTTASADTIGSDLETQLGIEGELAIELGRVVKAAYGGNASNTDRETIAGAMAGLASDDEKTRQIAFKNFNRTMKKLNAQNMAFFIDEGLYKTTERLSDTANTVFDDDGSVNEDKPKGTKAQMANRTQGVTYTNSNGQPWHYNSADKPTQGKAK